MSGAPGPGTVGPLQAPSLRRRLAAFFYEGVLLFGVVMIAGLTWGIATQQRHALQGHLGLQIFMFLVLGVYFAGFWSHGGQTVATKAWHVRLVDTQAQPVGRARAALRYLLAWAWFMPALVSLWLAGRAAGRRPGGAMITALLLLGVAGYAALVFLRRDRQFWHDAVCGTRLVDARDFPPPGSKPLPTRR